MIEYPSFTMIHNPRTSTILHIVLLCLMSFPAFFQQALGIPTNVEVIQQALADLTPVAKKATIPLPFSRLLTVAIAFEQIHVWKTV